jgi:uridine kinase
MASTDDLAKVLSLICDRGEAPVFVGIDGVDGAGKTTFADALAVALTRPVVRITLDDFHNVAAVRYRRGRDSAKGFWLDAFDYQRLVADVFRPLRESRRYRPAAHDLASDRPLDPPWQTAPPGSVVIIDGLFLQRVELAGQFDLVVYLDVPFDVAADRLHARDGVHRSLDRYVGASLIYFAECDPLRRADVVIDNK